ncbi:STAS domain-containing protein [Spirochaetia bacterium 38H-sp]|uniref:STAS domain-containing protein n=1 Tax=Rarispira pelagica TaxID=3141764 RepID=A0ABU9U9U4_9SPIR
MEKLEIIQYILEDEELIFFLPKTIRAQDAYSMYKYAEKLLQEKQPRMLLVDLSSTEYMDSTTIGTFLKLRSWMKAHGGSFFIANINKESARILREMHLYDYFNHFTNDLLAQIKKHVCNNLPQIDKNKLAAWYIKDAHECLIKAAPQLKESFLPLLKALQSKIAASQENVAHKH